MLVLVHGLYWARIVMFAFIEREMGQFALALSAAPGRLEHPSIPPAGSSLVRVRANT